MTRLSYIVLFIAMNILLCVLAEEEFYPNTYDNVDIKAVLENPELREEYHKCYMETGPCKTPEQRIITGIYYITEFFFHLSIRNGYFLNNVEVST